MTTAHDEITASTVAEQRRDPVRDAYLDGVARLRDRLRPRPRPGRSADEVALAETRRQDAEAADERQRREARDKATAARRAQLDRAGELRRFKTALDQALSDARVALREAVERCDLPAAEAAGVRVAALEHVLEAGKQAGKRFSASTFNYYDVAGRTGNA